MNEAKESLGLQGVIAMHVFVRDLERIRDHFVQCLDFCEIGASTPDFEAEHRARASVVEAGSARFVFMEPLGSKGESFHWLAKHPEGVGRVVLKVEDAERAFRILTARGATPIMGIQHRNVEGSHADWFDIATPIGDTVFRFIQVTGSTPMMPGLERLDPPRRGSNRFGFEFIDHITSNFLTLSPVLGWMRDVMGLEQYWDVAFHTQDVGKGRFSGSGLKSVVMWDPRSQIKFANNEPAAPFFKASQIYLFCEDHRGPGIQHVAITTRGIVEAVRHIRRAGGTFMATPGPYYDALSQRLKDLGVGEIEEDLDELRELGILVDGHAPDRYLLQIFMQEGALQFKDPQAGPLFIELIERRGDPGFGAGNFRALFESVERQQENEGRT